MLQTQNIFSKCRKMANEKKCLLNQYNICLCCHTNWRKGDHTKHLDTSLVTSEKDIKSNMKHRHSFQWWIYTHNIKYKSDIHLTVSCLWWDYSEMAIRWRGLLSFFVRVALTQWCQMKSDVVIWVISPNKAVWKSMLIFKKTLSSVTEKMQSISWVFEKWHFIRKFRNWSEIMNSFGWLLSLTFMLCCNQMANMQNLQAFRSL